MDRANTEVLDFDHATEKPVMTPLTQLFDLELAFVGGGIGDTVL